MAASMSSTSVLQLSFKKCQHSEEKSIISAFNNSCTFSDIYRDHHKYSGKTNECVVTAECGREVHEIQPNLTIGEVVALLSIRKFSFTCQNYEDDDLVQTVNMVKDIAEKTTKKTGNAFEALMAGGRRLPTKRKSSARFKDSLSRKDELIPGNTLIDKFFTPPKLDFAKSVEETEGSYVVQVLTNALWYITNQHVTISDAARDRKSVLPIPDDFTMYQGFNNVKRKKVKQMPLDVEGLKSHSDALYSILLRPVATSTESWREGASNIKALADCLQSYMTYLQTKNNEMKFKHSLDHPARTIAADATIEHRQSVARPKDQYMKLDSVLKEAPVEVPV